MDKSEKANLLSDLRINADEKIIINVMGTIFVLTAGRIPMDNWIWEDMIEAAKCRSKNPNSRDELVLCYDRDPKLFSHIHDYIMALCSVEPRWKCPIELKAELLEEAKYFRLAGMISKINAAEHDSLYYRFEVHNDTINVPAIFEEELIKLVDVTTKRITGPDRCLLQSVYSRNFMDKFVTFMLQKGYNLFAVNDLETRSVYHFRN